MRINDFSDYSLIKHLLHQERITQKELLAELQGNDEKKTSQSNFSKKITNEHLRFKDLKKICEILNYDIILEKRKN